MVRRRETRLRTVLPVRVFGMDSNGKPFTVLAHTLDITNHGARIAGLKHPVKAGDIIGLQRGNDKARFRVVWTGTDEKRNSGQAGLECVQENKNIWNVVLDDLGPDTFDVTNIEEPPRESTPAEGQPLERRKFLRYGCDIGVEMQVEGSDVCIFARCTDISRGGCYVESRSPFPVESRVFLCLKTEGARIRALGQVRSSHPALGMGLKFEEIGEDDIRFLDAVLGQLESGKKVPPATTLMTGMHEASEILRRTKSEISRSHLDKEAVATLCAMLDVSLGALDVTCKALKESNPEGLLRVALQEHHIQAVVKLAESIRQGCEAGLHNVDLMARIRTALDSFPQPNAATSAEVIEFQSIPGHSRTM